MEMNLSVAKREAALLVAVLLERCAAVVSEMTRIAPPREITQMGVSPLPEATAAPCRAAHGRTW